MKPKMAVREQAGLNKCSTDCLYVNIRQISAILRGTRRCIRFKETILGISMSHLFFKSAGSHTVI